MDKYELLACGTFLSDFDPNLSSIEEVVMNPNTIIWEPFENYSKEFLIRNIEDLAEKMKNL